MRIVLNSKPVGEAKTDVSLMALTFPGCLSGYTLYSFGMINKSDMSKADTSV